MEHLRDTIKREGRKVISDAVSLINARKQPASFLQDLTMLIVLDSVARRTAEFNGEYSDSSMAKPP